MQPVEYLNTYLFLFLIQSSYNYFEDIDQMWWTRSMLGTAEIPNGPPPDF